MATRSAQWAACVPRYVPDGIGGRGNPRSVMSTCFGPLTSHALIRAVADTAF
jgi:hypothetical protein